MADGYGQPPAQQQDQTSRNPTAKGMGYDDGYDYYGNTFQGNATFRPVRTGTGKLSSNVLYRKQTRTSGNGYPCWQ